MSQRIDSVGYIRVSRPGIDGLGVPGDRQRFTVAHEIGHLGIHADSSPPDSADDARRIERQAHRFASAFLAPADPLLEDWTRLGGKVTLSVLAELKAVWGISIKALVVLFQQLGIVEDDQATSLYKQISKRGWNKVEPVETTNEAPVWLTRALETKYGSPGTLQLAEGDALLAESYLQTWIDWSPLAKPGHVLDMPQRRKAGVVTDGRAAPVLPLNGRRGR